MPTIRRLKNFGPETLLSVSTGMDTLRAHLIHELKMELCRQGETDLVSTDEGFRWRPGVRTGVELIGTGLGGSCYRAWAERDLPEKKKDKPKGDGGIKGLKEEIGYQKYASVCGECRHCKKIDAVNKSWPWHLECHLHPSTPFVVNAQGICDKWEAYEEEV